jgi:cysteine desulfurase/selenocysteine lyase
VHVKPTGQAFEPGNPAYPALHVLDASLDYLAGLGMERIEAHTLAMSGALRQRLVALGVPMMTPEGAAARAGSIAFEDADPLAVREALEAAGVLVTGELGRVRASVHVHTTDDDLATAAEALRDVLD